MQINYAAIIEAANRRKDQLEDFQRKLLESEAHLVNMTNASKYFCDLYRAFRALDKEALSMIPTELGMDISELNRVSYSAEQALLGQTANKFDSEKFLTMVRG